MTISFDCPTCGQIIRAPNSAAGRVGKCRNCSQSLTVPELDFVSDNGDDCTEGRDQEWEPPHPINVPNSKLVSNRANTSGQVDRRKTKQHGEAYTKAAMMHECGLNKEAQLILIDIVVSAVSTDEAKAASLDLLGVIAFEERQVAVALKMWRRLVAEFPESSEAALVRERFVELAEVVDEFVHETLDNSIASTYLSHGDFWSQGKSDVFEIDTSWIDHVDAAIKWYDKVLREFPKSLAARIAYESKLKTVLGWETPEPFSTQHGIHSNCHYYLPLLLTTFSAFAKDFPNASTLQAFRFQIAQVYWRIKDFKNMEAWLKKIVGDSEATNGFYRDLAKRRLKNFEPLEE